MSRQFTAWISIFFALVGGTIAAEGVSLWQDSLAKHPSTSATYVEIDQHSETIALSPELLDRSNPN